ncbi:hypothetical protein AVEN_156881-1 [Araneus ventricosus]|uniref:Reverse transcriptase domain-containing protein n=1 Tax=Araneus ventricosus TaxID=182803 RepID=A0A4Y2EPC6_ARAVE|nr:hypothetical protein AVEN_156881-1 [Araneus ventricosus]
MELFNTCLKLAKFPDPLMVFNIILFHKHDKSKTEASSYRPISVLPTIGKVLENLFTQRLNFHLEKNNRLQSSNRKVILNTCEGPAIRDQKQGCPQGSSSGPALWNLVRKMKYFKKTGQLTPAFKPSQTTLSLFPMP